MNNDTVYDVAVAGGGLAGLSVAILMAQRGFRVAVLEKEGYPRHKVCGEYISNESRAFLERLGWSQDLVKLPQISRLQVSAPGGRLLEAALPLGGFGISRYLLDQQLAVVAQNNQVDLFTGCKVTGWLWQEGSYVVATASGLPFRARTLCGAWGKRSNLDLYAKRPFAAVAARGLDNYIGIKYHIRYPWPEDLIALHNFDRGYCGISRVEDDTCCLCYLTTADNLRRAGGHIPGLEKQVLRRNPQLEKIFSEAVFLYEAPLAISQISFQRKERVLDGMLLTGDTAGLIAPLCGNGMSMAFHSALLVSAGLAAYLDGRISREEMERRYRRDWDRQFGQRLRVGRMVQRMFGHPVMTTGFLQLLRFLPFLKQPLIRATHGKPF